MTSRKASYGVWDASCDKDARERYARWKAGIPADQKTVWEPLTKAMENLAERNFAYFKPGYQFTNAFTESSNRRIKTKQRDARGMKVRELPGEDTVRPRTQGREAEAQKAIAV